MAATITGVVYNDLNHNGQYDAGEPGLANVAVVLYNASAGCTEVRTGADGSFSLTVNAAGAYTVYEPVTAGSGCPADAVYTARGVYDVQHRAQAERDRHRRAGGKRRGDFRRQLRPRRDR